MRTANPERRRQIRQQLRAFYGDSSATQSASRDNGEGSTNVDGCVVSHTSTRTSAVPPELDLDSESFSVQRYTTELFRVKSLMGIVQADTWLLRTVNRLETELQELVYRNYAKLISASDTIREMRANVTEMDTKLQVLSGNVESIDCVSKDMNEKLQQHKVRIEKVIRADRMARKVKFLVDLPDTMRFHLERHEYSECARCWVMGDSFLVKHKDVPKMASVYNECKEIATRLYASLKSRITAVAMEDPEAADIIQRTLEEMRAMRGSTLFEDDTQSTGGRVEVERGNNVALPLEEELLDALRGNVRETFDAGTRTLKAEIEATLPVSHLGGMDRTGLVSLMKNFRLHEVLAQLKGLCAFMKSSGDCLSSVFKGVGEVDQLKCFGEQVQAVLVQVATELTERLGVMLIAVIEAIANDGALLLSAPSEAKEELTVVFSSLSKHLAHCSTTLKGIWANYVHNIAGQEDSGYAIMVDQSVLCVVRQLTEMLEAKVVETDSVRSAFRCDEGVENSERLHGRIFGACLSRFTFGNAASIANIEIISVFIDSNMSNREELLDVQQRHVSIAQRLVVRGIVLLGQYFLNRVASAFSPANAVDPSVSDPADHGGVAKSLREFVLQLDGLYKLLKQDMLPPPTCTDSGAASAASEKPCGNDSVGGAVRAGGSSASPLAYGATGGGRSGGPSRNAQLAVSFTRRKEDAIQASVKLIFSKQSQNNAVLQAMPREFTPACVVASVALHVLKGVVELVRQEKFTRCAFQCVQVSCTFLLFVFNPTTASPSGDSQNMEATVLLGEWVRSCGDEKLLKEFPLLLNECCTCAYERCIERAPLTAVIAERLVRSVFDEMDSSSASIEA
uniref:Vacuolar protein sorting-associated protein 51 homolog n=1 Tax=Trypanosoma congolense (strain IL3000) TaxID=1068625 RepID=G0UVK1_TRYCI|nr:conserved hypothetical protein [Trypanosoma congolense IL3000]